MKIIASLGLRASTSQFLLRVPALNGKYMARIVSQHVNSSEVVYLHMIRDNN